MIIASIQKLKAGLLTETIQLCFIMGSFLINLDTLFRFSSIFVVATFTMREMSSNRVNSLKLMVRCLRALRLEIPLILLKLLPRRFSTWRYDVPIWFSAGKCFENEVAITDKVTYSDLTENTGSG